MTSRGRLRLGVALTCGLVSAALVLLVVPIVYGVSEEYAGRAGLQVLLLAVLAAGGAAALASWSWPGLATRVRVGVPLAVVVAVGLGGLAAAHLGERAHRQRVAAGSESFTCNGPHAEIRVDARVDATFAALPRIAPIYGPVAGSRYGCTAAVSGDGAESFTAYADAFRDLDGWAVTAERSNRFVMERDGVRVALRRDGAPDRNAMIEVSVTDQRDP